MEIKYTSEKIQYVLLKSHARAGNYETLVNQLDKMQRVTKNEPNREPRKVFNAE